MPKILELKDIDGDLWVRLGKPGDFPDGVALWTPDEQQRVKWLAARDEREACASMVDSAFGDPEIRDAILTR